jgi:hypothetical protein
LGAIVGLVGLVQLATAPPAGLNEWALAGAIAAFWTIYVAPSADDRDVQGAEQSNHTEADD